MMLDRVDDPPSTADGVAGASRRPATGAGTVDRSTEWWAGVRPVLLLTGQSTPLPGAGSTRERWRRLREAGRGGLAAGKLLESHVDALAILAEAGRARLDATVYAVWASQSGGTGLRARKGGDGWVVSGSLRFASGIQMVDRALIWVSTDDGTVLCDVSANDPALRPVAGSWPAIGMADTHSLDVTVEGLVVEQHHVIGDRDWYLARPGFWVGAMGVAAVWAGGIAALLDDLCSNADATSDPWRRAAVGDLRSRLAAVDAMLDWAADLVDTNPHAMHRPAALAVRAVAESAAVHAITAVDRAMGPVALCRDLQHARRVADLQVYVRQCHGERDLARLGDDVTEGLLPW